MLGIYFQVVWSEIKQSAPLAYKVIQSISFSQKQYNDLLNSYYKTSGRNFDFRKIACNWVRENEFLWMNWIPEDFNEKLTLYIGGIFPITGVYWKQSAVLEGMHS